MAGELNQDKQLLAEARKAFERLLVAPAMNAMYLQEIANNPKADKNFPHPNVVLGLGKAAFATGDYTNARPTSAGSSPPASSARARSRRSTARRAR